jgi:hypothetical protein
LKEWQKLFLRAGGVAAGVTVALAGVALTLYWWSERPKQWSDKAVTGQINELGFQPVGEELHFTIKYALTNSTDRDYVLPNETSAALMGWSAENGALSKLDGASWAKDLTIPAKQKVGVDFVVPYKFEDYNTSAAELSGKTIGPDGKPPYPSKELLEFVSRRLKEVNGLVLFDFVSRYKIVLPDPKAIPTPKASQEAPLPRLGVATPK